MITVQFANETQGEDLSIEPILVTITEDYELAYNITGTSVKTFEATSVELREKVTALETNLSEIESNKDNTWLPKLEEIKTAINGYVPTGVGNLLLSQFDYNLEVQDNIKYRLLFGYDLQRNAINEKIAFIQDVLTAFEIQLNVR